MALNLKGGAYQDRAPEHMERTLAILRPLEGRSGFVFALCSIEGKHLEPRALLDLIREHAERLAGSFGRDANPQHRFEQFLRALNDQLAQEVMAGTFEIPIQSFHALVGIAVGDIMYLSGSGDLTALFLHRMPQNRYQVFNLFRSIQTEQALPTWEKAFAVVLDGDLRDGDAFCVANRDLPRFVPQDELNAVLSTLPPAGATEKIRQYFPHNTNLAMIILQSVSDYVGEKVPLLTEVSIERLEGTREETERVLDDQRPRLSLIVSGLVKRLRGTPGGRGAGGEMLKNLGQTAYSALLAVAQTLGRAASAVGKFAKNLLKRDKRTTAVAETRERADVAVSNVLNRFNSLPVSSKYLAVAAIAVLFALGTGLLVLSQSRAKSQVIAAYASSVSAVTERIEKADAALIYKDEAGARKLYAEALELANALPVETPERQAAADELLAKIHAAFDQLRHIVNIPEPPVVADLSNVMPSLTGRTLVKADTNLLVFGADKAVYRVDPAAKTIVKEETTDGVVGIPAEASLEDGFVYFLDDRPGISRYDIANKQLQVTNLSPADGIRWADLQGYGGKLYVLQPGGGGVDTQIVKHLRSGTGFDGGTKWIKAKTSDLSDAVSFAIDASIFVLKSNGTIIRFASGSEVGWDAQVADPPVTGASDIWTDAESAFVYVLEPANNRLIVYNKADGTFVVQYRSDSFIGLTDFLVDEATKTVYLLAGPRVFAIQTNHLN